MFFSDIYPSISPVYPQYIPIPHGIRIVAHEAYLMALITALGATAIYLSEDGSAMSFHMHVMCTVCITYTYPV